MSDKAFIALMILLMVSDPSPLTVEDDIHLRDELDRQARSRGYSDWYEAYHKLA